MTSNRWTKSKMRTINEENDAGIRLHTNSCDKLYRWSMWRMYLNEELSRVISSRRDFSDTSKSVTKVTAPYIRHRESIKYGRQMKKLSKRDSRKPRAVDILPDNVYLVYGIPRVSINKIPDEVRKLYVSVPSCQSSNQQKHQESSECPDPAEQITKMFEFVTSDFTKGDVSKLTFRKLGENNSSLSFQSSSNWRGSKQSLDQKSNSTIRRIIALPGDTNGPTDKQSDVEATVNEEEVPLVSKSRLFWEKLASKRTDIIDLKSSKGQATETNIPRPNYVIPPPPAPPPISPNSTQNISDKTAEVQTQQSNGQVNNGNIPPPPVSPELKQTKEAMGISNDILQTQQQLLKKTVPKRTSKDLWRTLAERKTEILQLREMNGNVDNSSSNSGKKHESKTSQLWSFLFSKNKELVRMKQGSKGSQDGSKGHQQEKGKKHNVSNDKNSSLNPDNFEDNFQKELAAKLRKRREKYSVSESTNN
ncbi:hypothetical protein ACF0H5_005004 [Mactra antiquata]